MSDDIFLDLSKKYKNCTQEEKFLSSGSVIIDEVLSRGKGIPLNKYIQISSESGTGKTTIVLNMCREACASGMHCVYLDVEKGVNNSQLDGIGLTPFIGDLFHLYTLDTFEEAEDILDKVLDIENTAYVIVDSITQLIPEKCLGKSISEVEPGLSARYTSEFLRKYKAKLNRSTSECSIIFINQMRMKLNFRGMSTYDAAGGSAQKFNMDIRLKMSKLKTLSKTTTTVDGKEQVPYGVTLKFWADKNRYNSPNVNGEVTVLFGKGVSNIAAYQKYLEFNHAIKGGGGGYYTLTLPTGEYKARGQNNLWKLIKEHIDEVIEFIDSKGGYSILLDGNDDELD